MQFGILGPVEARTREGERVAIGGARTRALLALLLLDPGRPVSVDRLIEGQYGDDPPAGAANAVQAQVSRLRRALPPDVIEFIDAGYRLVAEPGDVDACRFDRLARDGRALLAAGRVEEAARTLREALGLWRGEALADVTGAPFADAQRTRLEEIRISAREDLIEAELALPEGTSVAELRRLVAAHPLRERLRGQLMRALVADGRQAAALAEFEEVRRLLADELGADPSPELAALHVAILRGDRDAVSRGGRDAVARADRGSTVRGETAVTPEGGQGAGVPGGRDVVAGGDRRDPARDGVRRGAARRRPPAQLTTFVGREAELARLAALRDARLITLTGPGGTGKTRLAIEAAGRQGREVCFADLSTIAPGPAAEPGAAADDDVQVPLAVLGALGLRETGLSSSALDPAGPADRLVAALADQELLLILDNCEHVIAAAARLARRLLGDCPRLSVLATSREPLGLTGETLVPLAPLAVPPPGTAPAEALGYPAARLFADRAAAVRPGFEPGAEVAEICAALDGVPLAIELAAARLRSFTPAQIAERLGEQGRFTLLSRGDRTAAARHRTLRGVVEWSWRLLDPQEQELAGRFSVFSGATSLEAAERVCGPGEVLADLVDKSFVERHGGHYRMLETIRLFCAERLAESGDPGRVRDEHAACYLALARRADPWLRRAEQLDWLARLAAEDGNLRAALRHTAETDPETGLRLVAALATYWWLSGGRDQAAVWARRVLDRVGPVAPEGLEEEYALCVVQAAPDVSAGEWEQAWRFTRSMAGPVRHPIIVLLWGMAVGPPDPQGGPDWRRVLGTDTWSRATGVLGDALMALLDGRMADAEGGLTEALAAFGALGERWGTAQAHEWLALIASYRGDWRRARLSWERALELHDQLGAWHEMVDVLCRRAAGLLREGDAEAARADLDRAGALAARGGGRRSPVIEYGRGELARWCGDLDAARRHHTAAYDATASGALGTEDLRPLVLTALGRIAQAEGDVAEAARLHGEALARARASRPLSMDLACVAEGCAGAALLDGSASRAAFLLGVAVALRGTTVAGDRDVAGVAEAATRILGGDGFAAEYARGAALAPETARREALTALP